MRRGWSGGAKVPGKLPVPGRPTSLEYGRARAYCTCSGCGWGCLDIFSLIYLLSFPSPSWETARYRLKYCLKGPLNPNNQPFRVRNFGDKLISNFGCHSNQSFPCTYYNRENVSLVYRKRTDFGARCVQLLIRIHRRATWGTSLYGSRNNNMAYRSLSLPIISSTNLQKTWTGKNNLDML